MLPHVNSEQRRETDSRQRVLVRQRRKFEAAARTRAQPHPPPADLAHGKLRAYIPGGFEFVSTHDIVQGHLLAMQKGRSGQNYIISTAYASVDELMGMFHDVTGMPLPKYRLPPLLMAGLAEIADKTWYRLFPNLPRRFTPAAVRLLRMQRRADHGKAKRELGYQPTELKQAVQDAYSHFVQRGIIKPLR